MRPKVRMVHRQKDFDLGLNLLTSVMVPMYGTWVLFWGSCMFFSCFLVSKSCASPFPHNTSDFVETLRATRRTPGELMDGTGRCHGRSGNQQQLHLTVLQSTSL